MNNEILLFDEPYKVSILVPVYGVEKYIERCARSIFEQTYNNIEVIFVNDCSKDRSVDILKKVISEYPNRKNQIRIIDHSINKGLGAARNTAISQATGEFILWVDSDDYIDNTAVVKTVKKQLETGADIVSFDTCYDYGTKKSYYRHPSVNSEEWKLLIVARRAKVMVWGRLIRLKLYKENNISVDLNYSMGEDYQVVPFLAYYSSKLAHCEEYLYYYNKQNETALSASFSRKKTDQSLYALDKALKFFSTLSEKYDDAVAISSARMYAEKTISCCRYGDKEYFDTVLKTRLASVKYSYLKFVPTSYRFVYYLNRYYLLRLYSLLGHIVKRI